MNKEEEKGEKITDEDHETEHQRTNPNPKRVLTASTVDTGGIDDAGGK